MRRLLISLVLLGSLLPALAGNDISGRVIKVLPFFLDLQGHTALSPSLYDRDAYQAYLRTHSNECSAMRFDVLWKASDHHAAKLTLRIELRGLGEDGMPRRTTLEKVVTPHFFRHWNSLTFGGKDYKNFGQLVAWRVTLRAGDQMLSEQKSFLW